MTGGNKRTRERQGMSAPRTVGVLALALATAAAGGRSARAEQQPAAPEAPAPAPAAEPAAPPAAESRATEGEATATLAPALATTPGRWHGSILLLDQSATTQTLHVGGDYQSYDPTYELWLALKPRFYLYETKTDAVSLNLWANLYLELTNSDTTTRSREPLIGPTFLWATYGHSFYRSKETKTVVAIGPRAVLPTDKASRGSGQLIGVGGLFSASQYLPVRGAGARNLKSARVGVSAIYNHPFAEATSPVNDQIRQIRQDVAGRTVISDQLTGAMNVKHALSLTASGDLRILSKLELSLSYVWLNAWAYAPGASMPIPLLTGPAQPMTVADPTTYRLSTWTTASLTYEPTDDFSVSLGYYNLASQLGPDGTRRNPLWSPSARFFLTLTGNLDVLYDHLAGHPHATVD
ncbi:MAG TPA: hypothetical protein VNO55_24615 [Polyangia bacterium]|nr:hypothetical protein [Polyangia bacterium]